MCGQRLGWELGHSSGMVIFPLWASIPGSAMEITTLAHNSGASERGFVKGHDTAWGWQDYRVTGSQLRLRDPLYWSVILSELFIVKLHIISPKRQISISSHTDGKDPVRGPCCARCERCWKLPCTRNVSVVCSQHLPYASRVVGRQCGPWSWTGSVQYLPRARWGETWLGRSFCVPAGLKNLMVQNHGLCCCRSEPLPGLPL